jgi:hypothetical protein
MSDHNHYGRNKVCQCHYGTMRSIICLIVIGRLCELCMILLVDSMLVYVFLLCTFFYAVACYLYTKQPEEFLLLLLKV